MVISLLHTDPVRADIKRRLNTIIVAQLGVEIEKVVETASFAEDLNADSLEIVQIVMEIEDEFDLEFSDVDAESILTVGDAVKFIQFAKK